LTNATGLPLTTGVTGTLPTANGGTNLTSFTSGGVVYASSSSALATGSALTFDGAKLTVTGATQSSYLVLNAPTDGGYVSLQAGGTTFADFGSFKGIIGTGSATDFYLGTRSTNNLTFGTNFTEGMRLTSTGLGIGTSSPATKLEVNGSIRLSGTGYVGFGGGSNYIEGDNPNNILRFATNNVNRLIIDASGNLGLGVTPSAWRSNTPAFQIGSAGVCLFADSGVTAEVGNNVFLNSSSQYIYLRTDAASRYRQYQGVHSWLTASSGTAGNAISFSTAMTLDASGNLLVGMTSNPSSARLVVNGSGGLTLDTDGTNTQKRIYFRYADAGYGGSIQSDGILTFYTGNTPAERARITTQGYFKASDDGTYQSSTGTYHEFSNSSADNLIKFRNSNASNPYGFPISYSAASPNGTGNSFFDCSDTGGARAALRSNGGFANYSANDVNLSDRREKTNFAPATSYLDKICAIPVQTFNYIDQNMETDGGLTLGVVAQDVQAVAPELVMESNWAKQGDEPKMRLSIYQTDLQYALMKALQELKADFDAYKASHP
jgi:hypothetical protein